MSFKINASKAAVPLKPEPKDSFRPEKLIEATVNNKALDTIKSAAEQEKKSRNSKKNKAKKLRKQKNKASSKSTNPVDSVVRADLLAVTPAIKVQETSPLRIDQQVAAPLQEQEHKYDASNGSISREEAKKLLTSLVRTYFKLDSNPDLLKVKIKAEDWLTILNSPQADQWILAASKIDVEGNWFLTLAECFNTQSKLQPKLLQVLKLLAENDDKISILALYDHLKKDKLFYEGILQSPDLRSIILKIPNVSLLYSLLQLPAGVSILNKLNIRKDLEQTFDQDLADEGFYTLNEVRTMLAYFDLNIAALERTPNLDDLVKKGFKKEMILENLGKEFHLSTYKAITGAKTRKYWVNQFNYLCDMLTYHSLVTSVIRELDEMYDFIQDCKDMITILRQSNDRIVSFKMYSILCDLFGYYFKKVGHYSTNYSYIHFGDNYEWLFNRANSFISLEQSQLYYRIRDAFILEQTKDAEVSSGLLSILEIHSIIEEKMQALRLAEKDNFDEEEVTNSVNSVAFQVNDKALAAITPAARTQQTSHPSEQDRKYQESNQPAHTDHTAITPVARTQQTSHPSEQDRKYQESNQPAHTDHAAITPAARTQQTSHPSEQDRKYQESNQPAHTDHAAITPVAARTQQTSNPPENKNSHQIGKSNISKEEARTLLIGLIRSLFKLETNPSLFSIVLDAEDWLNILKSSEVDQWLLAIVNADVDFDYRYSKLSECSNAHPELLSQVLKFLGLMSENFERSKVTTFYIKLKKNKSLYEGILQSPYLRSIILKINNPSLVCSLLQLPNGPAILRKLNIRKDLEKSINGWHTKAATNQILDYFDSRVILLDKQHAPISLTDFTNVHKDKIIFLDNDHVSNLKVKTIEYWLNCFYHFHDLFTWKLLHVGVMCNPSKAEQVKECIKECEEVLIVLEQNKDKEAPFELHLILNAKESNFLRSNNNSPQVINPDYEWLYQRAISYLS